MLYRTCPDPQYINTLNIKITFSKKELKSKSLATLKKIFLEQRFLVHIYAKTSLLRLYETNLQVTYHSLQ